MKVNSTKQWLWVKVVNEIVKICALFCKDFSKSGYHQRAMAKFFPKLGPQLSFLSKNGPGMAYDFFLFCADIKYL